MNIERYQTELLPTYIMWVKKEIGLKVFVENEKLRNEVKYFFEVELRQTPVNFGCATCISTALRYINAVYQHDIVKTPLVEAIQPDLTPVNKETIQISIPEGKTPEIVKKTRGRKPKS